MTAKTTRATRPLIALTVGDPAGIGPEITLATLAEENLCERFRLLVIGPGSLRPADLPELRSTAPLELVHVECAAWLDSGGPAHWELGRPQVECGQAALKALAFGAQLAQAGLVEALVTGPVCKQALHLAGERVEGQTELLTRWSGAPRVQMMVVAGNLRAMLLTRHLPLSEALRQVRAGTVLEHLHLLRETLRGLGFERPRLALAGLNPHAGEGGLFGIEELEILGPAVERARASGIDVSGPVSPDTVFGRAARGEFDAVLSLYHDQAFGPIKLVAPDTAVTLLAGLPYLRVSPVHGTAFDIAGKGIASHRNLLAALEQASEWGALRVPATAAS